MAGRNGEEDPVAEALQPDDVALLLDTLPARLRGRTQRLPAAELLEVVLDLGRVPEARLLHRTERLGPDVTTQEDIAFVIERVGQFSDDNRAGIARTLHRISGIRNRKGQIIGLTLRVGRAVFGTIDLVRDLIESGRNVLMLGPPGVGKTTKLREAARVLADVYERRVIVIDTSNEIAGDGDVPHPGIGSARRMQVPRADRQHAVMIEAVENHMPQVIVVDEIGTEPEAAAARTIAERGVQLIGTAHGNSLENLILNPTLSDLIGGVHQVILSDEEARRRRSPKTISERRAPPTFDVVVEMVGRDELIVHADTAVAVDRLLEGEEPGGERRTQSADGRVEQQPLRRAPPAPERVMPAPRVEDVHGPVKIHPYSLSRDLLDKVIRDLRLEARAVTDPEDADIIVTLKSRSTDARLRRLLDELDLPLYVVKSNTTAQLRKVLQQAFNVLSGVEDEDVQEAVREVEHAIDRVINEGVAVPLAPRRAAVRRLQHRIVSRYHLEAESQGREPLRHLIIHPRH